MNRIAVLLALALCPSALHAAAAPEGTPAPTLQLNEIGRIYVAPIGPTADEKRLRELLIKRLDGQGYKTVDQEQAQGVMMVKLWRRRALNDKITYYVNALVGGPDGSTVWNGFPGKRAADPGSPPLKTLDEAAALVVRRFFEDWNRSADVAEQIGAAGAETPAP